MHTPLLDPNLLLLKLKSQFLKVSNPPNRIFLVSLLDLKASLSFLAGLLT